MDTHFRQGDSKPIFQRPLSREQHEGKAMLLQCVRPYTEFSYPGLIVEEWLVRFDGETETFERVIAEEAKG